MKEYPAKVPIFLGIKECRALLLGVKVLLEDKELGGDKGPTTKELKELRTRLRSRKAELLRVREWRKQHA